MMVTITAITITLAFRAVERRQNPTAITAMPAATAVLGGNHFMGAPIIALLGSIARLLGRPRSPLVSSAMQAGTALRQARGVPAFALIAGRGHIPV